MDNFLPGSASLVDCVDNPRHCSATTIFPGGDASIVSTATHDNGADPNLGQPSIIIEKLLVILRDSRKLIGWLRSYDQFANLVLQDTVERTYVGDTYGDVYRGVFVVRGENVVLLGEIDKEKEAAAMGTLRQISVEEARELRKQEQDDRKRRERGRNKILSDRGFSLDIPEHDQY